MKQQTRLADENLIAVIRSDHKHNTWCEMLDICSAISYLI